MEELQLDIVSPEKVLFRGQVHMVQLPGIEGTFSILHNHAPLVAALKKGEVSFRTERDSELQHINIDSGFVEVNKNKVTVCAE